MDDLDTQVKALLQRETSPHLHDDPDKMLLAEHLLRRVGLPNTFCPLPWSHVMAERHTEIKPCCRWQATDTKGDALQDSSGFPLNLTGRLDLHAVLNSEPYKALRRDFMDGKTNPACHMCHEQEAVGIPSYRINKLLGYVWEWHELAAMKQMQADGTLDDWTMHWFDFRLSNICNFKCRMCGPGNSSRIASEYADLGIDFSATKPEDVQQWFDEFAAHVDQAKEIYFAGGEPLLMDTHWRMLDQLIAVGNSEVSLSYSTNLSTFEYRGRSVLDLWPKFKRVHLAFSVDHVGAGAEYIRHGTIWDDIVRNHADLRQRCPHVAVRPTCTVSAYNVLDITGIVDQLWDLGMLPDGQMNLQHVDGIGWLSTQMLPPQLKQLATARIAAWCDRSRSPSIANGLRMIADIMNQNHTWSQQRKRFMARTAQMDSYRRESCALTFPELWQGMEEASSGF